MTHRIDRHRRPTGLRLIAWVVPILVLVGLLATPTAAQAAAFAPALTRAPYLTDLIGTHVNVNWATNQSATSGQLKWGAIVKGACKLNNNLNLTPTSIAVGTVNEYQWKASLTLPSQGTYCYRPLLAGVDLLATNPTPQFQTQVPVGNTPFSFAVFGDWGQVDATGANADQANVLSQVAASGVRFAVTVGDNGYPSGSQTNYGDLQQTGPDTSAIFGPSFWTVAGSTVPLFNTAGNHGLSGPAHTDITTWTQDSAVSTSAGRYQNDVYCCVNGTTSANYGSEWYAFNAGPARFYILDSAWGDTNTGTATVYANDAAAHFLPGTPEYTWLLNDLKTHPSTLKFAFSHYPLYSDNPNQSSDTSLQGLNNLEGMLGQYGVDIVFNGHAHLYERNLPSAVGMPISYVTGGGGAALMPIGPCHSYDAYGIGWSPTNLAGTACGAASPPTAAANVFHFLKVSVNNNTVTVAPTDETGHTFDVQTYTFTNVPDTVIDSAPPPLTNLSTATLSFHSTRILGATYKCSLDGAPVASCTSPASYSGLGSGSHTFSVAATTADGTDTTPATTSWTVDHVPPTSPTNLAATVQSAKVVSLSWTAATDNFSVGGYDVQRNGVTIGSANLDSTGAPLTSYLDVTAAPSTTYQYAVVARDSAGNVSPPSTPVSVTTPASNGLPALVQSASSSTTTLTLAGPSAPGDLLVLTAGVYTGTTKPISAVSDGRNTWIQAGSYTVAGQNSDGDLWYVPNAASVRTITVTTLAPVALQVQEFTNVASVSPLDGVVGAVASSRSVNSGLVTPTTGYDLVVGFIAGHTNAQTINVSSPGYTLLPQQTTTSPNVVSVVSGYQVQPGTSAQSIAASLSNTMYWAAGVALFKAAAPPNDFSLSATPSSVSVVAGQGGSSVISSAVTSGNPQSIALAASGLPTGATASFTPSSVTAGGSSTLTLSTTASTPPGSYPITVTGTGSSFTHTTTVTLTVAPPPNDFSLSASPSSVSVVAGQGGSSVISSAVTSGNPQSIALAASGLPTGATASFTPSSVTAGGSSTLTLSTTASTPPGSYPITVTGTGSSFTHTTTVTLTVAPPPNDFSLSASPSSVSVVAGQGGSSVISSAVTSGNAQPIALAVSGLPLGATGSFDTSSITAGQSATLTLNTSQSTTAGSYPITVTGSGPSATHTTTVTLTVTPPPNDFSLSASPSSVSVVAGQGGSSVISSAVTSGNPQSIALAASGLPTGATASFNPGNITAGQSATLTLSTTASTPPGNYPITVTGTGSSFTHTTTVTLTVTPPPNDFSLSASPSSVSVVAGQGGSSVISSAVTSGNAQPIALAVSGLPLGATGSFDTSSITAGQSATLTFGTTASTPPGNYPITVTGTGSSFTHTTTVTLTVTPPPNDFSLSASPSSVSVVAGQGGSSVISSAVTSGNAQPIALAVSGLPLGATGSFDTSSITAGQSATLTLTTTSGSTPAGSYPITVTGSGPSATHTTTVTLTVTAPPPADDFSLTPNPSTISVTAGQGGSSLISSAVTSGNAQPIALAASGLPTGATASFDTSSITAGQSATLTLTTTSGSTPAGSYPITVTGSGASATHTTTLTLTVTAPPPPDDFSLTPNPSTVSVTAGQGGSSLISSAVTSGNAQPIALAVSGLPLGATGSFDTTSITAGQSATLTLTTTSGSTPAGSYPITITGSGASATHTTTVTLTVTAPPPPDDFSLTPNPSTISVTAGQGGSSLISSAVTSGNAQPIALAVSGLPLGATGSFDTTSITAGQSATLTLNTSQTTTAGSYPITITGSGPSATHTTTVTLTITSAKPPPALVQAVGATEASTSTTLTATLPAASTAGNLLVLSASVYTGTTNHITSVTDSAGNLWQRANAWSVASHNSDGEVWYAANAAPATSIVAHLTSAATMALQVLEFSGIATSNPLDTSAGTSNTSTAASSGPLTPAASGELLVGLVAGHASSQAMTVTSTGFTVQPQQNSTGTIATVRTGYQVLAGTGATSFSASFGTAMYWAAGLVAFKAG